MSQVTPTISVCMIARDEAACIGRALDSIRDLANQVVVVDTGSTDATPEIARQRGAEVHHFEWCDDFSAARNESLRHATGDYVLIVDCDETLAPGVGATLRASIDRYDADGYFLGLHDGADAPRAAAWPVSRVFRRTVDLRFRNRLHESALDWLAGRTAAVLPGVHIRHDEQLHTATRDQRNLRIARIAVAEQPSDLHGLACLAVQCLQASEWDEAASVCIRAMALSWDSLARTPIEILGNDLDEPESFGRCAANDHVVRITAACMWLAVLVGDNGGGERVLLRGLALAPGSPYLVERLRWLRQRIELAAVGRDGSSFTTAR